MLVDNRHVTRLLPTTQIHSPLSSPLLRCYAKRKPEVNKIDLSLFPPERIRNFSIIAHIDHGKSTLSDRLLEITGTVDKSAMRDQFLDKLEVERERGITVKANTAVMIYKAADGNDYLLNLIDTPGHVDFSYEVSRSMQACNGALLLVDSGQGIQAQTLANYYMALEAELAIIPIMTKVDQITAIVSEVAKEMQFTLGIEPEETIQVSAKTGKNCELVLQSIVDNVPPPVSSGRDAPLRALLFDSWFDPHHGVICLVQVRDGCLSAGDNILMMSSRKKFKIVEVGIMFPERVSTKKLYHGQVGYITGVKDIADAVVGDTIVLHKQSDVEPLPGFKTPKPMVYAGVHPVDGSDFNELEKSIQKLLLTDGSVTVEKEFSSALGNGFRMGFLGVLHMEIFKDRLEKEFNSEIIISSPTVTYEIYNPKEDVTYYVNNSTDFPNPQEIHEKHLETREPIIRSTIMTPTEHMKSVIALCQNRRGRQISIDFVSETRVTVVYEIPLAEIVSNFYDSLKSLTRGYGTLDYEDAGFQDANLTKVEFEIHEEIVDAFSIITHTSEAVPMARRMLNKLKEVIDRQLFEIRIRAIINNKSVASDRIKAYRKNVTAKLYGGDITRKKKLLEQQKEGKKRMKSIGRVNIPHSAFVSVFRDSSL